jgi:hypothetical protein
MLVRQVSISLETKLATSMPGSIANLQYQPENGDRATQNGLLTAAVNAL